MNKKLYAIPTDQTNIVDSAGNVLVENTQQTWQEEFNERFGGKQFTYNLKGEIESFISKLLAEQEARHKREMIEAIQNSPLTFGLLDRDGKGGAILVEDVVKIIKELEK